MSAVLDLAKLRRTRRFPWDERMPDGTPAAEALTPRVLRMPTEGNGMDGAALAPRPTVDLSAQPVALDAPPRQFFTEGTPAPVLEAPTALRRTIALTPSVEEMPSEALSPIPPAALAAKRRFTRPEFQQTGDEAGDLTRYGQSLAEWKDPADRNGRLKSFGLGALRGALRGLAAGGLGGAIGGALAGGIHGGVAPNADEREWRDTELARTGQKLGALQERRIGALKLRGMEADVQKTEAERDAILNPKPKEPYRFKGDDGLQYEVDPLTKEARPIAGQGRKAVGGKVLRTTVRGGKVWYETEEGLKPALDPTTGEQLAEPMREVTLGGQTFSVPETKAAEILGSVEAANAAAGNQYGNQSYEDTVRQIDKENAAAKERHAKAEAAVKELRAAIKAGQEAAAKVNNPPVRHVGKEVYPAEPEEVARYREAYEKAQSLVNSLGQSIRQNYGDLVDDDPQMKLPILLKAVPAPKSYPSRPAPQRRSASASPRSGGTVRSATPSNVMSVIERIRSRR